MAQNLLQDTFAHYNTTTTQMPTKWTSAAGSILTSKPTGSTYAFQGAASVTLGNFPTFASGQLIHFGGPKTICTYSNAISPVNITFAVAADGRLYAVVDGVHFLYSTFALTFAAEYQIQVYCAFTVDSAVGDYYSGTYTFQIYVNGVLRLSGTLQQIGQHYDGHGAGDTSQLNFADFSISTNDGSGGWAGDLWVTDGELLGQCPEFLYLPIADGPVVDWTPSTGSDHFALVNTRVPTDTDYNHDSAVGNIDEYQMATVPAGTVKGVQITVRMEKDAASTATLQIVYRNAAGTTMLSTPVYAPTNGTYAFFRDVHRKSIFTGVDWTVAEINGMSVGVKRVS